MARVEVVPSAVVCAPRRVCMACPQVLNAFFSYPIKQECGYNLMWFWSCLHLSPALTVDANLGYPEQETNVQMGLYHLH